MFLGPLVIVRDFNKWIVKEQMVHDPFDYSYECVSVLGIRVVIASATSES